jgi:transcriptional regulator with XRE-family HTH domain
MLDDYALSLGGRLRAIRQQQGLSLHAVEEKSDGRWKAVVVGSYERGDRAITVAKLAELAAFYGVPVGQLLPDAQPRPREAKPMRKVVVDLEAMARVPAEVVAPLARFVASIQAKRGDYNGRVLTIRADDLNTVALLFDQPVADVVDRLTTWGVITPLR